MSQSRLHGASQFIAISSLSRRCKTSYRTLKPFQMPSRTEADVERILDEQVNISWTSDAVELTDSMGTVLPTNRCRVGA